MSSANRLSLFEAFGIELEYMIVDAETLSVRPISDHVLKDEHGEVVSDIERGPISWSNELTHHVIELKTTDPAADLKPLANLFQQNICEINQQLKEKQACLLPTAMHPWMHPATEMQLWPHDYHVVYDTFDKIFDCRGHGWANLQSMHINLPFANDEEFGRLHAAVRLILPLLPALAASSPVIEGEFTGFDDSRLNVYRTNSGRIASVTGRVIPEQVYDQASYDRDIFQPMFRDIAPFDPQGILQQEFLNARGAIARFSRGAIEIRVIDLQECPEADLAIAQLTVEVLKRLVSEDCCSYADQQKISIETLEPILLSTIEQSDTAIIADQSFLQLFGFPNAIATAQELWIHLAEQTSLVDNPALQVILKDGCLAKRIRRGTGVAPNRSRLFDVYSQLRTCLAQGEQYLP